MRGYGRITRPHVIPYGIAADLSQHSFETVADNRGRPASLASDGFLVNQAVGVRGMSLAKVFAMAMSAMALWPFLSGSRHCLRKQAWRVFFARALRRFMKCGTDAIQG